MVWAVATADRSPRRDREGDHVHTVYRAVKLENPLREREPGDTRVLRRSLVLARRVFHFRHPALHWPFTRIIILVLHPWRRVLVRKVGAEAERLRKRHWLFVETTGVIYGVGNGPGLVPRKMAMDFGRVRRQVLYLVIGIAVGPSSGEARELLSMHERDSLAI